MGEDKVKTPNQYADEEMNKKVGKAIAKRKMKIKQLEQEIKKLESGEMAPDADDEESSHHTQEVKEEVKVKEIIREVPVYVPRRYPPQPYWPKPSPKPNWRPDWIAHRMTCSKTIY